MVIYPTTTLPFSLLRTCQLHPDMSYEHAQENRPLSELQGITMSGFIWGIYGHKSCYSPNISVSLPHTHMVVLYFLAFLCLDGIILILIINRSGIQVTLGFDDLCVIFSFLSGTIPVIFKKVAAHSS